MPPLSSCTTIALSLQHQTPVMPRNRIVQFLLAVLMLWIIAAVWRFAVAPDHRLFLGADDRQAWDQVSAEPWHEGMLAYREGRWEEAARLLAPYGEEPEAAFYHALSLMELEREQEAEALWIFLRYNRPEFYHEATWYLSLTQLKLGHIDEAYLLMDELRQGPHPVFSAKAEAFVQAYLLPVAEPRG
jgi:hypothetical protein